MISKRIHYKGCYVLWKNVAINIRNEGLRLLRNKLAS